jgi:hypothetical protein
MHYHCYNNDMIDIQQQIHHTPPPPPPPLPQTTSPSITVDSFDCQSLQRSLKRVRLTCSSALSPKKKVTSPGELRFVRDIRYAITNQLWKPMMNVNNGLLSFHGTSIGSGSGSGENHHWDGSNGRWEVVYNNNASTDDEARHEAIVSMPSSLSSHYNETNRLDSHLYHSKNTASNLYITVTQDLLDPMELILNVIERNTETHSYDYGTNNNNSNQSEQQHQQPPSSSTTIYLHIPRLYPHQPPMIHHIDHYRPPKEQQQQQQRHNSTSSPILSFQKSAINFNDHLDCNKESPTISPHIMSMLPLTSPSKVYNPHYHRWIAGNQISSIHQQHNNNVNGTTDNFSARKQDNNHEDKNNNKNSSYMYRLKCPSKVQGIVIRATPEELLDDDDNDDETTRHSNKKAQNYNYNSNSDRDNVVYITRWTPLHRMSDIIQMILHCIVEQVDTTNSDCHNNNNGNNDYDPNICNYNSNNNNNSNSNNRMIFQDEKKNDDCISQFPLITDNPQLFTVQQHQALDTHKRKSKQHSDNDSNTSHSMNHDCSDIISNNVETSLRHKLSTSSESDNNLLSLLHPNRFDVGYNNINHNTIGTATTAVSHPNVHNDRKSNYAMDTDYPNEHIQFTSNTTNSSQLTYYNEQPQHQQQTQEYLYDTSKIWTSTISNNGHYNNSGNNDDDDVDMDI